MKSIYIHDPSQWLLVLNIRNNGFSNIVVFTLKNLPVSDLQESTVNQYYLEILILHFLIQRIKTIIVSLWISCSFLVQSAGLVHRPVLGTMQDWCGRHKSLATLLTMQSFVWEKCKPIQENLERNREMVENSSNKLKEQISNAIPAFKVIQQETSKQSLHVAQSFM